MNEVTKRLISDASCGPGDYVRRFMTAKPAKPAKFTPTQEQVAKAFDGVRFARVSKALVYDKPFRYLTKRESSAFASLVKGGILVAEEVSGPIPGAEPSRIGAHDSFHYILRRVAAVGGAR